MKKISGKFSIILFLKKEDKLSIGAREIKKNDTDTQKKTGNQTNQQKGSVNEWLIR